METPKVKVSNVRIKILAAGAYAAIEAQYEGGFASCDVQLPAGKSAVGGLNDRANEDDQQAQRLLRRAQTYRQAAAFLTKQESEKHRGTSSEPESFPSHLDAVLGAVKFDARAH